MTAFIVIGVVAISTALIIGFLALCDAATRKGGKGYEDEERL